MSDYDRSDDRYEGPEQPPHPAWAEFMEQDTLDPDYYEPETLDRD